MPTDSGVTAFLGLEFANASYAEAAREVDRLSRGDCVSLVVTPNVDHIVMLNDAKGDRSTIERFARAYDAAALRFCDSRVLQTLAWLKGVRLDVVTGSDLTVKLFDERWLDDRDVALIGGDECMLKNLKERFPAIRLAQHIPPMGILGKEAAIVEIEEFLKSKRWHYIFFIIGAPRGEIIAHRVMALEGVTGVALCVGASIEFLLGRKKRAPRWMQFARLEWAFRLMSEPRRLWRRYLVKGPRILAIVRRWKCK
jgi:exopolysaccharide biosynthesis WecB/TagA/CpsF family protein